MSQSEKIYLMGFIFCIAAFASTNDWQTVVWGIGAILFFGLFVRPTTGAADKG